MRRLLPALVLLAATGCGSSPDRAAAPAPGPRHFAPAVEPTAHAAGPVGRYLTAALTRPTRLYERPGGRVLTKIRAKTEFGSQSILGVLAPPRPVAEGRRLPAAQRPPRLGPRARGTFVHGTDLHISVDRSDRTAVLRDGDRALVRFPVAVGRPGNETPLGRYAVTDKLEPTDGDLALRLLRARADRAPDAARAGLARRGPARDPRDAGGRVDRAGRVARVHARAGVGPAQADAPRPARRAR